MFLNKFHNPEPILTAEIISTFYTVAFPAQKFGIYSSVTLKFIFPVLEEYTHIPPSLKYQAFLRGI